MMLRQLKATIARFQCIINPTWPSLLGRIRDVGGFAPPPPLNIFELSGARVPILLGNDLPRSVLPYVKVAEDLKHLCFFL